MLFPVLSTLLVWAGAWLYLEWYCKRHQYKQRTRSSLEIAAGFSNTSFIGFPLVVAYFGAEALPIAIVCDQAMFALLSSAGIIAALRAGKTEHNAVPLQLIFRKLITFPPFVGCVLALLLTPILPLHVAEPFFDKLAVTIGPLALFSIGLQLKFDGWKQQLRQLNSAMFYKLLIAPALVLVAALLLKIEAPIARIAIFEAAMPTVVTASIIAEAYHLNTKLVNLMIGMSIVISLLTTFCWSQVISYFY
jgi:predicted permease